MKRFVRANDVRDWHNTSVSCSEAYRAGPGMFPESDIDLSFLALFSSNAWFKPAYS